ncbi:MAG: hypothetical protein ABIL01_25355 [Pseudomonadota bacterium]
MWFLYQKFIAILLSLLLLDTFQDCHSLYEIWHTFRGLPHVAQIGVIGITLIVLSVIYETLKFISRVSAPILWRLITHLRTLYNLWVTNRRKPLAPPGQSELPPPGEVLALLPDQPSSVRVASPPLADPDSEVPADKADAEKPR